MVRDPRQGLSAPPDAVTGGRYLSIPSATAPGGLGLYLCDPGRGRAARSLCPPARHRRRLHGTLGKPLRLWPPSPVVSYPGICRILPAGLTAPQSWSWRYGSSNSAARPGLSTLHQPPCTARGCTLRWSHAFRIRCWCKAARPAGRAAEALPALRQRRAAGDRELLRRGGRARGGPVLRHHRQASLRFSR